MMFCGTKRSLQTPPVIAKRPPFNTFPHFLGMLAGPGSFSRDLPRPEKPWRSRRTETSPPAAAGTPRAHHHYIVATTTIYWGGRGGGANIETEGTRKRQASIISFLLSQPLLPPISSMIDV
eukprot:GHVS01062114.1.p1 GENE.GHVS01062114.1~~GHVS01062114.1.p1  ORF type:complete len:121 (-),score=17.85 GHVS01062114.1:50-412(-)